MCMSAGNFPSFSDRQYRATSLFRGVREFAVFRTMHSHSGGNMCCSLMMFLVIYMASIGGHAGTGKKREGRDQECHA